VHQATCLALLSNAVIAWDTVYMAAAVDRLRIDGHAVQETDPGHLTPCRYENISEYRKHKFDVGKNLGVAKLRLGRVFRWGGPDTR
jgi:hypothetical protein